MNNKEKIFIVFSFFVFGIVVTIIFQNITSRTQAIIINDNPSKGVATANPTASFLPSLTPTFTPKYQEVSLKPKVLTKPSGKFTIVETQKITADKESAETGETVNFSVTLKNSGDEKKFLTHICFNHSGNVTFGCLLNKNIYPGDEFNINNSMIFATPGTYSVWVTWSQDKTNFYRPVNYDTAIVRVE